MTWTPQYGVWGVISPGIAETWSPIPMPPDFQDFLRVQNSNNGVDATLRTVTDGKGDPTPLRASTTEIAIDATRATGGTVLRSLGDRLADRLTPQDFGAGLGAADDTDALNAWLDACSLQGRDAYAPAGLYPHSAPLVFNPRTSADRPATDIFLSPRAIFRATSAMTTQLSLGTANPDFSGLLRGGRIQGGIFDCNNLAQTGVHAVFCNWFLHRDTQVWNYLGAAFKAGSTSSPSASYEAFYDNVRAWVPPRAYRTITGITNANPGVVTCPGHGYTNGQLVSIQSVGGMTQLNWRYFAVANATANTFQLQGENTTAYGAYTSGGLAHAIRPSASRGIFFENCGDSHVANSLLQGCFRGVDADNGGGLKSYDGKYVNTHVWNFFENGEVETGFYLGGDNDVTNCQVDGPFLYAYRFADLRNSVTASNVNMPPNYGGIDNRSTPIRIDTGGGVGVVNCNWKAIDASCRLAADVSGDLSNYRAINTKSRNVIMTRAGVDDVTVGTWALCAGGATPSIFRSQNIVSVVRNSAGRFTLSTAFALPLNCPILVTAIDGANTVIGMEENGSRGVFSFVVLFRNSTTGAAIDPGNFSVIMPGA